MFEYVMLTYPVLSCELLEGDYIGEYCRVPKGDTRSLDWTIAHVEL